MSHSIFFFILFIFGILICIPAILHIYKQEIELVFSEKKFLVFAQSHLWTQKIGRELAYIPGAVFDSREVIYDQRQTRMWFWLNLIRMHLNRTPNLCLVITPMGVRSDRITKEEARFFIFFTGFCHPLVIVMVECYGSVPDKKLALKKTRKSNDHIPNSIPFLTFGDEFTEFQREFLRNEWNKTLNELN